MKTIKQCASCPWRTSCEPEKDIPHYSPELHAVALTKTINAGAASLSGPLQLMACHKSKTGKEIPCAGWMQNQLGEGNNLALRIAVMHGRYPAPRTDGPQHACLDDTMPASACTLRKPARG